MARFKKLGEGGFNQTFLITMHDSFQFRGRIPYPTTKLKQIVTASKVATIDFLRMNGIPVLKIYSYLTTLDNLAGTEYMFIVLFRGLNLGNI